MFGRIWRSRQELPEREAVVDFGRGLGRDECEEEGHDAFMV